MRRPKTPIAHRELDRREFVLQAGKACTLITVGSLVGACIGGPTSPSDPSSTPLATTSGSIDAGVVTVNVRAGSALDRVGGMALVLTTSGNFLAARTSQSAMSVTSATCTHDGCPITDSSEGNFACQCDGSRFNATGHVMVGPASQPLRLYASQYAGAVLTFAF